MIRYETNANLKTSGLEEDHPGGCGEDWMTKNKIDFDDYADDYKSLVADQLSFFESDNDYFARYKVEHSRNLLAQLPQPERILDFGCGIGESIEWFSLVFPDSVIHGFDVSEKSLETARSRCPEIEFLAKQNIGAFKGQFDLVFSAGVFHHIEPSDRVDTLKQVRDLLSPRGRFIVFEHNPYNPVTRRMVNTCPFDADAVLLKPKEWHNLLEQSGLRYLHREYTLFFPSKLNALRPLEQYLRWLPLGGQYCIVAAA